MEAYNFSFFSPRWPIAVAYVFVAALLASLLRSAYCYLMIRFSKNPWRVFPLIEERELKRNQRNQEREEEAYDRRSPNQPTYGDY